MKLSDETLGVLKNFSEIGEQIIVQKGSRLKVTNSCATVFAFADITETFEQDFGVANLRGWLNIMNAMPEAEVEFGDKAMTIFADNESVRYVYSDERCMCDKTVKLKELNEYPLKDVVVEFDYAFDAGLLKKIRGIGSALEFDTLVFKSDGDKVTVSVVNKSNDSGNSYVIDTDATGEEFEAKIPLDRLKIEPGTYKVSISPKTVVCLEGKNITYFFAVSS